MQTPPILIILLFVALPAYSAADKTDHPLIQAYTGSDLRSKDTKEFDEYRLMTGFDKEEKVPSGPKLEGRVTKILYKNPADRSVLEIFRNYESALKVAGAEILYQCDQAQYECAPGYAQAVLGKYNGLTAISNTNGRYIVGKVNAEDHVAYVAVAVGAPFTNIHVVEVQDMDKGMVNIDAGALGDGLDKNGFVVVDGIYFDTDKTTLRSESTPALQEVATLLKERPALMLYVVGHTDMQGSLAYNMQLSEGRAKAVTAALVKDYGVAAGRLEGRGVGPLSPQASNGSGASRALNRRVVLVARLQ